MEFTCFRNPSIHGLVHWVEEPPMGYLSVSAVLFKLALAEIHDHHGFFMDSLKSYYYLRKGFAGCHSS